MSHTPGTPGPWSVVNRVIRAGHISLADMRWNRHNEVHGEANARLMSAAPDLLAACMAMLESWTRFGPTDSPLEAQLRAAIARATGKGE